jgi:hypothetical protein
MQYRETITQAWEYSKKYSYLKWIAAIPIALQFVVSAIYIPLRFSLMVDKSILDKVLDFIYRQYNAYQTESLAVLGIFIFIIILYLLLPTFCDGALIATIGKVLHSKEEKVRKQFTIAYAFTVYLPLVELKALTSMLNPLFVFLVMSFVAQYNMPLFEIMIIPALIVLLVELIVAFGLIYSKYELVIHSEGVIESVRKSVNLVLFNVTETVFVLMLLVLIVLRSVVNMVIVFLVPLIIYLLTVFLAAFLHPYILYGLMGIGTLFAFYYAIKLASMLSVFMTFALVLTHASLSEKNSHVIIPESETEESSDNTESNEANVTNVSKAVSNEDAFEIIGQKLLSQMEKVVEERKIIKEREERARLVLPDQHTSTKTTLDIDTIDNEEEYYE